MTISLMFGFFAVAVLALCIILLIMYAWKMKQHYISLRESYENLEKLNSNLRAQRHDYLNHLQVVYGLMEMEEYEELKNYLQPVYKDMLKTGKALRTSKPAINALLKAKMDEAENKGIDVYIEVKSNLQNLHVEDWELCKVLSNLWDNAMTALAQKNGEKKIELDITEDSDSYRFSVSNNGPMIPKEMRENIFKQGITTKNGEGHGMGLYIVSNVLKACRGTIELKSEENETNFSFSLPKEERR